MDISGDISLQERSDALHDLLAGWGIYDGPLDITKPITNPKLVESMDILVSNPTDDTVDDFCELLYDAVFITPLRDEPGLLEPNESGQYQYTVETSYTGVVLNEKDNRWLVMFTDWPSFYKWLNAEVEVEGGKVLVLTFENLLPIVWHGGCDLAGFIINPASQNVPVDKRLMLSVYKEMQSSITKELDELFPTNTHCAN